jgi:hypothetical protein
MADGESDTGHWSPGSRWRLASGVWRLASGVYENALERPFYPEKCASKRQKRPEIGLDSLRVSGLAWSDPANLSDVILNKPSLAKPGPFYFLI